MAKALTRRELAMLLVWAFRDEQVETTSSPHPDAATLYHNVMALPACQAAVVVRHARSGDVPPSDPIALARWTKGLLFLIDMLQQPMCDLELLDSGTLAIGNAA